MKPEDDAWEALLAVPLDQKKRKALTRLAFHCRRAGLGPGFNPADRDALYRDLHHLRRRDRILNSGLVALCEAVTIAGMIVDVVEPYPTPRLARKAANAALGEAFLADLGDYLAGTLLTTVGIGRMRPVSENVTRNHRTALLLAARICFEAGLSPSGLDDLLTPAARRAVIDAYNRPASGDGGLAAIFSALVAVADVRRSAYAADVRREATLAREGLHAIRSDDLQALARYHVAAVRDVLIGALADPLASFIRGPVSSAERGCLDDEELWNAQVAIAAMLSYYAIANWNFVATVAFIGTPRRTRFGMRPELVAEAAPGEPLESRLPELLVSALDAYFGALPPALQGTGRLFAGLDGAPRYVLSIPRRLGDRLRAIDAGLTPHGLVDLAVLDMIWDGTMTSEQMALAARFTTETSFRNRYDRLVANIASLRHADGGQRPTRAATKAPAGVRRRPSLPAKAA